jgi:hypothetical protein
MASLSRTRTLIALACCIFFLAATAHLLHTTHIHHEHNKVVAESGFAASVCSLDMFVQAVYVPPVLTAVMLRRLSRESVNFSPETLLESSITRAPPPAI